MESIISLNESLFLTLVLTDNDTSYDAECIQLNSTHLNYSTTTTGVNWVNVTEVIDNISYTLNTGVKKTQQIISDDVRNIFIIVNMAVLCQIVSVVGVVVNVLNICIFVKQGFRDALNVTLTGLALADLGIVTFAVWLCVCYNPLFSQFDLPFKPMEFVYLTAGLPRLSCARVSSWILASFERCLCITRPLTFKSIVTPRRSLLFTVVVYTVMAASVIPVYYTSRLIWAFDASRNSTIVSLVFTSDRFAVDNVAFMIGVFLSVGSFSSVAVCTIILIWSLKEKTKWRDQTVMIVVNTNKVPLVFHRNKRVGKMVSTISMFFIVCYTPNTVNQLVMSLVQEFAKNGPQVNANQVSWSFGFLFESINATVNTIIYFKMSSRFRSTLLAMFKRNVTPDFDFKSSSSLVN